MRTGSGETTIREPLYVFAVDDDLAADLTDEVKVFADHVIRPKNGRTIYYTLLTALGLICVIFLLFTEQFFYGFHR
jgi:hypothetical protein